MSMITMTGKIINTFQANSRKDDETGEMVPGAHKIQIMGQLPLESGESRLQLVDLTCRDIALFKPLQNQVVRFPLGVMARGNEIIYFIPKGSKPEVVKGAS